MRLDPDFREFIACCVQHDVRFLVVGGYAVAAHGHPRYTKDLDVWIWIDPSNAARLIDALDDFGFGALGLTASDFIEPGTIVQLGYPPKRIDIITSADGITFSDCYENRIEVSIDGLKRAVPFIGLHDLLANKRAAGRPQDLADADTLSRHQPGT